LICGLRRERSAELGSISFAILSRMNTKKPSQILYIVKAIMQDNRAKSSLIFQNLFKDFEITALSLALDLSMLS
jgi:hypothetical protein